MHQFGPSVPKFTSFLIDIVLRQNCAMGYIHPQPLIFDDSLSYFEIVFSVLEQFWWRKCCQKRGGKWDCNRRRETIIGSQVQEIEPKGA